jgi:hypothetical protein
VPSLDGDKLIGVFSMVGLAACDMAPQKGAAGHRLIFAVDAHRIVRGSAPEIRTPGSVSVVTIGARVDEKLVATIAEPETEGIGVSMGVEGGESERSGIEDDHHFIAATAVCGEDVIATMRERVQISVWRWLRPQRKVIRGLSPHEEGCP